MVRLSRIKSFLPVVLCLALHTNNAQAEEPEGSFWHTPFGMALRPMDELLLQWQSTGIDTNYITLPKLDHMFYLGSYAYMQGHDLHYPQPDKQGDFHTRMHTMQAELEIGIDWRGLALELPIPIKNRFTSSYGIARNGNVWGARIRYKSTNRMKGVIEQTIDADENSPLPYPISSRTDIQEGQMHIHSFYTEGYYVFNHRRFCLGAGLYGDMIQKRSAGSLFVMANYKQSRLSLGGLLGHNDDTFRTNNLALGLGYGYNLSIAQGKFCLHASVIPMFSVVNRLTHKYYPNPTGSPIQGGEPRNSRFGLNAFGRVAFSYSMTEHLLLNAFADYRQYVFKSTEHLDIEHTDATFQFNIGWRF